MGVTQRSLEDFVKAFLSVVDKLDYDMIDKVMVALENEKSIRDAREAFVLRMMKSKGSWGEDEARRCIIEFQRMVEGSVVVKDQVVKKKEAMKKSFVAPQPNNKVAAPEQQQTTGDEIDDLINELTIKD
jgi:hypothetical protein